MRNSYRTTDSKVQSELISYRDGQLLVKHSEDLEPYASFELSTEICNEYLSFDDRYKQFAQGVNKLVLPSEFAQMSLPEAELELIDTAVIRNSVIGFVAVHL